MVTTEQQLTEEQLKPFWDQVKHKKMSTTKKDSDSSKKYECKNSATEEQKCQLQKNLRLITNLLDVLLRLGYGKDLIVCGKH